jgi:anti-sigma B factor antagonist
VAETEFAVARVSVVQRDSGNVIVLEGEVDLYARDDLQRAFYETADHRLASRVTVDLTRAEFIDSTTLGELVRFRAWLRRRGTDVTILCTSREIRRVFEVTGLDRVFEITGADGLARA